MPPSLAPRVGAALAPGESVPPAAAGHGKPAELLPAGLGGTSSHRSGMQCGCGTGGCISLVIITETFIL